MKISNTSISIYLFSLFTTLLIINRYNIGTHIDQLQYLEFIVDITNVFLSLKIYKSIKKEQKGFILLPISMIMFFAIDVQYRVMFYLGMYNFVLHEIIILLWGISTITFLMFMLYKFAYDKKESILILSSLALVSLAILMFAPNFLKFLEYPYYSIDLSIQIIIFYLTILLIINIRNKYILFTTLGICIGIIGQFSITECYLLNHSGWLIYGEFLWLTGLIIIAIGMAKIIRHKISDPKNWFLDSKSIRNKLSFLIFHITLWSFIISCFIITRIYEIPNKHLAIIPIIGMIYSMASATFSVLIVKHIEKPFIVIKNNISSLFYENTFPVSQELNLLEFKELQDFFVESYEYKKSLQRQVVSIASRMAHDIKSPILIMENIVKSIEKSNNKNIKIQLTRQLNKINYISRCMLKENKVFEEKSYGIQSIFTIAKDLISDKQIEWDTDNSLIKFNYLSRDILWLNNSQAKIKNILSNLLNNAYEANVNNKEIIFNIDYINSNAVITIQDFGCGIPLDEIDSVLDGKSLKMNGNGIGLSSANKFAISINGKLTIESTLNVGTTVTINFPTDQFPKQYTNNIRILTTNVIILDDDPDVINTWQQYFLKNSPEITTSYFVRFSSLRDFLSLHNSRNDITYLLDYRVFSEKINAIDIVKEFNLTNVYLITNYAEDEKLQEEIKSLPVKLIPKSMLNGYVTIDIAHSPKAGRTTKNTI